MTTQPASAPCDGPLLYVADNLSVYQGVERSRDATEHSHDDLQIALPLDGSFHAAWQTAAGHRRQHDVSPGALLAYSSQQPHLVRMREDTELAVIWLPAPVFMRAAPGLTASDSVEIKDKNVLDDPLLLQICLSLLAEVRQNPSPARLYVDAMANLLAAHLVRHHSTGRVAFQGPGGLPLRELRLVTDYIQDHLAYDLSLADLSGLACLSESRFGSLFRQSTGMSPYQYVLNRRIERAKGLLSAGRLSIGEVALHVGFCDQSQFTRQFKKLTGLTPKAFLRAARR